MQLLTQSLKIVFESKVKMQSINANLQCEFQMQIVTQIQMGISNGIFK